MKHYDAIVIGSGQAGSPLCKELANAGKKTALIEKRFVGGTCVNDGCTPTKTMIASAKAAYLAAHSDDLGIHIDNYQVNMKQIKQRKDELVLSWRNGSLSGMENTENLDLIFGEATFIEEKTIQIKRNDGAELTISADLIFIDTGTTPFIPAIEGLNAVGYLTSTTILDVEEVPEHLLIIGGNYVALEFAQMFHRFGSKITVLERGPSIMAREDEDIAEALHTILTEERLNLLTNTQAVKFEQGKGHIEATIQENKTLREITCSHILVATGRKPTTEILAPQASGIQLNEKGFIEVNEKLESNVKGIYALGEVNGGPAFTHIAYNDYTIVFRNLFEGADLSTKDRPLPYCMFTDPQLGRIGLSEQQAIDKGYNIKVAKLPMKQVARAQETGDTRGLMKAVVDADTKQILGAAILGEEGGEIMSVIQMAMMGGLTYDVLEYCVFAHPTYSESLNNLFMTLDK